MFLPALPRNLEASFRDLSSEKATTRASAVADVVRHALGDESLRARAITALEKRLRDDDAAQVRSAAAVALSDLRAHEALSSLLVSVEDANPMVRQMALSAIGEIGDARGEPRLRRALADARPEVRYQALIAYARVVKDEADLARALEAALEDADDAISHIALRIAEEKVDAGAKLPERFVDRASKKLTAEHADVAAAAAILLAKLHDPRADDVIAKIVSGAGVAGRMPGKEEEQAVVELAGALEFKDLAPALARRAWGFSRHFRDTCAYAAKISLARLGDARAKNEIVEGLTASNKNARKNAIVACGRAKIEDARSALEAMKNGDEADLVRDALAALDPKRNDRSDANEPHEPHETDAPKQNASREEPSA